jgi:hypothetical protein
MYTADPTGTLPAPAAAIAAEDAPKVPAVPDVDVDVTRTERHEVWLSNPVVLAIGGGVVLLLILLVMAGRGGGTTIIKEK